MSIPFIRKYPHNRGAIQHVVRPFEVEQKALDFLLAGGWYTAEILKNGIVRLTATDAKLKELVVLETPNGVNLEGAVDALVDKSLHHMGQLSVTRH